MLMGSWQTMLLFIPFPENHLHVTLQGEYGPLPHLFRLLPLVCFFFSPSLLPN